MAKVKSVRQNMDAVTMEIGGRERVIQFDMNAFAELENKYGSVDKAMEHLSKGRIQDIKIILWAALLHDEAVIDEETGEPISYNITPYNVGGWIKNPMMLKEASEKLGEAMGFASPEFQNDPKMQEEMAKLQKELDSKNV